MTKKYLHLTAAILLAVQSAAFSADGPTIEQFKSEYANYQRFSEQRQWTESLPHAKNAYEMGKTLFGENSKNTAALSYNYGLNLIEARNFDGATSALKETLALYELVYGRESSELIPVLMDLDHARNKSLHKGESHHRNYDRAINLTSARYGDDSIETGMRNVAAGEILLLNAQSTKARKYLYKGHEILERKLGERDERVGYAAFNIGKYELAIHEYDKAVTYLKKALISFSVPDQPSNRYELSTHGFLVQAYENMDKRDLATEHCLAIGKMTPATDVQNYQPLVRMAPRYPASARQSNQEGYVVVEYEVDEMGFVTNPRVIDRDGSKAFESVSIDASRKFRYAPTFVDGKAVVTKGVKNKFTYLLTR